MLPWLSKRREIPEGAQKIGTKLTSALEFRLNGRGRSPRAISLRIEIPIEKEDRRGFTAHAQVIDRRDPVSSITVRKCLVIQTFLAISLLVVK